MSQFFSNMSTPRRFMFAFLVVAIAALASVTLWWTMRSGYSVLAGNLRPADATEIGSTLSKWNVPYRFGSDGKTLLVPSDQLYQTRIRLAEEDIPRSGVTGFEAFKDSDYGVTEFAQRVNYQRALQGELERTIDSMQEVQFSRVHLTIHHAGLFDSDKQASKAAVTLALRPGKSIHARQIRGIQRLVASAVEGLDPGAVTVLDQTGAVLSHSGDADDPAVVGDHLSQESSIETALRKQARSLIARALSTTDFTVSVAVRINYDKVHRVSNRVLGDGHTGHGVLVSEKTSTQVSPDSAASTDHGRSGVRNHEVTYAHGQESEEIDQAPGQIEQISVGIVVPKTLTNDQVASLDQVISAGLGLDAKRGDHVDIASMAAGTANVPAISQVQSRAVASVPQKPLAANAAVRVQAWRNVPVVWYGVFAAVVLVLLGAAFWLTRRRHPARLTHDEREQLLDRIRAWCEEPVS